jgi:hypothetical protein
LLGLCGSLLVRHLLLLTSIEKAPSGDRWIHEIKFEGYRVRLHIHNAYMINAGSAIIDGEIGVPGRLSKSWAFGRKAEALANVDFSSIKPQLKSRRQGAPTRSKHFQNPRRPFSRLKGTIFTTQVSMVGQTDISA